MADGQAVWGSVLSAIRAVLRAMRQVLRAKCQRVQAVCQRGTLLELSESSAGPRAVAPDAPAFLEIVAFTLRGGVLDSAASGEE